MPDHRKAFKRPPKRFEPRGLSILHEDHDIVVVDKACGLLTIATEKGNEKTAHSLLGDYVRKGNSKSRNRVFIVHRLDRETSGILIFAKSEEAKSFLMLEWPKFEKKYVAVVHGAMSEPQGRIESYLAESGSHRVYSVKNPDEGKLAQTRFQVLRTTDQYSLLELELLTGRKHQIRVQLSDEGCPVVGDKKYGAPPKGVKRLALHARSLTIAHPHSKEPMTFITKIPGYFTSLMSGSKPG
jgi:tRNA pseudouridine32 synthase/23S rRNA pseudouridine746 synthase/23S rRNA pseudouridine1911/1915/1917 synthase